MIEIVVDDGAIITPGIAGEEFVAAGAGQDHLSELRSQLGGIVVRIGLANARFFEMPGELGSARSMSPAFKTIS